MGTGANTATENAPRGRTPVWKSVLVNLGVLAVTLLVCGLLGEAVVRIALKKSIWLLPRYHTDAHYGRYAIRRLLPNTTFHHTTLDGTFEFRTNRQGYRSDTDWSYDKPPGTVRVLSLGDSNTEGFEVRQEYTFSAVLERLLARRGVRAEVLNTGISGFGTAEELVYYENEGVKYHPDYVVLGFSGNDPVDNLVRDLFDVDGDTLRVTGYEHLPGVRIQNFIYRFGVVRWLSEHSYFYSLAFNSVWTTVKVARRQQARRDAAPEFVISTEPVSEAAAKLTTRLVERLHDACRRNGARLIVVDIIGWTPGDRPRAALQGALADSVRAHCDVFLDNREFLARYSGVAELLVPHGNRHISEFTHIHYAEAIGDVILAERAPEAGAARATAASPAH